MVVLDTLPRGHRASDIFFYISLATSFRILKISFLLACICLLRENKLLKILAVGFIGTRYSQWIEKKKKKDGDSSLICIKDFCLKQ